MSPLSRTLLTQAAAVFGVALVTLGLYAWSAAGAWALRADRVEAAVWCVRLAAAASAAAGQVLFARVVLPGVFGVTGRRRGDRLERGYGSPPARWRWPAAWARRSWHWPRGGERPGGGSENRVAPGRGSPSPPRAGTFAVPAAGDRHRTCRRPPVNDLP